MNCGLRDATVLTLTVKSGCCLVSRTSISYSVEKGIDANRLYREEKSTNTRENLLFAKEVIEQNGLEPEIAIATSEYHVYRAGLIAESLDMEYTSVPGKTAIWLFPTYYIRELYGILYEWVF